MPALNPLLALDVSTRAQADAFAPEWDVSTRSVRSTSDSLEWTMTITRELAAALESSVRVIGIQIEIDKGDGTLVPLMQTEIDGSVRLKASRDGYGSRTLSFTLKVPPSQSPFYSAWPRGPHRVRMTGYLGLPGLMQPRPMFAGHVAQSSWEAYPSLLRVDCQDVSALLASEMLAYNLDPGSLRTRKSVFREIFEPYLTLYGIEFGHLDFGADDGRVLFKGISEGGTVNLLQWAAAFLAPIARRLNFGDGSCNVEPSYTSGPVVRIYRANDIANLTVSLHGTSDPNAVVMSGTVFAYIGPSGHRTEIEIKITRGVFAPASAVRRQDHVTGVISALSGEIAAVDQEISRTVTTRVYDAGTIVSTSVREWGWYSARACPNEQLADGSVTFNHTFDVFQYADGWRLEAQQQYQLLRQTTATKELFSDAGQLLVEDTMFSAFLPISAPIGQLVADTSIATVLSGEQRWQSVAYGAGLFVAVAIINGGVMTSPDGLTLTNRENVPNRQWTNVIFGNGIFLALERNGGGVMTSPDGVTWTIQPGSGFTNWQSVTYGNGVFVASLYTYIGGVQVMTSFDGITWTSRVSSKSNLWVSLGFDGGRSFWLVGIGVDGVVSLTSPDGIVWTRFFYGNLPGELSGPEPTHILQCVAGVGALFVAVGYLWNRSDTATVILTSPDGLRWTEQTSAADNDWQSIAYGAGLFVAVASSGSGNRVMTSPDGVTWTIRASAESSYTYLATLDTFHEVPKACLVTENGEAWVNGREEFTSFTLQGAHNPQPDGSDVLVRWDVFRPQPDDLVVGARVGANVYGPAASKRFAIQTGGAGNFNGTQYPAGPEWVVAYTAIDEQSYRRTTSYEASSLYVDQPFSGAPLAGVETIAGSIPPGERSTSAQTAQPASVTVIDAVREALLGKEVDDHQQNDFCETIDELRVCAIELLRDKAPAVEFDALIDWTSAPGKAIALLLPDAIPSGEVLTAWDVEWMLNGVTGENKQHVIARWLPQELR